MTEQPSSPLSLPASGPPDLDHAVFVGIDWADQEHVVCVLADGSATTQPLPHRPQAIAAFLTGLRQRWPDRPIAVALEQKRGALMAVLLSFEFLLLYPVNPKQLARYREALSPSGSKSDPTDAGLLAMLLQEHHRQLRVWRPDDAATRELALWCELRRKAVEARKKLVQQLTDSLKLCFPLALEVAGVLTGLLALDLLRRWPTHAALARANPDTLRRFFREQGLRSEERLEELLRTIRQAVPLTTDRALIEPQSLWIQTLVEQIRELRRSIQGFDGRIKACFEAHGDAALFAPLPGAGAALGPRLLAALGSDRRRYQSAAELQSYSGIAPVTRRSGKTLEVRRRFACAKFLRQTFHEYANQARRYSRWSGAYYRMQRSRGQKHQAAVRALAYKWIRILFRVWQTRTPYDESRYIEQLRRTGSPVIAFLDAT